MANDAAPDRDGTPVGSIHSSGAFMLRALARREDDPLSSIILAAIAAEAFLVELVHRAAVAHPTIVAECPQIAALGHCLHKEPGAHAPSLFRFQLARLALAGSPFQEGAPPFQGLAILTKLRNKLVHPAPEPVTTGGVAHDRVGRAIVGYLRANGLICPPRRDRDTIFRVADSPEVARWACLTSARAVRSLVECIPPGVFRHSAELRLGYPWDLALLPVPDL